jgi:hypothetical protein
MNAARDAGGGEERDEVDVLSEPLADVGVQIDPKCTIPKHACNFSLILVRPDPRPAPFSKGNRAAQALP